MRPPLLDIRVGSVNHDAMLPPGKVPKLPERFPQPPKGRLIIKFHPVKLIKFNAEAAVRPDACDASQARMHLDVAQQVFVNDGKVKVAVVAELPHLAGRFAGFVLDQHPILLCFTIVFKTRHSTQHCPGWPADLTEALTAGEGVRRVLFRD